jgi:hypothetical protein
LVRNRAQTPTTLNAVVRRSVVDRVGGFVESFKGMFEDQAFFAKVHLDAATYVDGRVWARYRQHPLSCSARAAGSAAELDARKTFLDWLHGYVAARGGAGLDTRLALVAARIDYQRLRARHRLRSWSGRASTS